jgi:NTP pyrophosphatase (non-canonical NTP hydrolase)
MGEINEIIEVLVNFRNERDWAQFHDSKNLAIALSIEASELNELYLWKDTIESENVDKSKVKEELADILAYALLLAEKNNFNVKEIILDKVKKNNLKYPVEKSKGTSKKYNEL